MSSNQVDEDDDFDYGDALAAQTRPVGGLARPGQQQQQMGLRDTGKSTIVLNQPYDEAVELSDDGIVDDSVDTHALSSSSAANSSQAAAGAGSASKASGKQDKDKGGRGTSPPPESAVAAGNLGLSGEYGDDDEGADHGPAVPAMPAVTPAQPQQQQPPIQQQQAAPKPQVQQPAPVAAPLQQQQQPPATPSAGSTSSVGGAGAGSLPSASAAGAAGDASSSPGGPTGTGITNPGLIGIPPKKAAYNPQEFASLRVPDEIRALFEHIGAYKPRSVELETKLKCFVPEFIPAVGDIDSFVKVPRPDGQEDRCGLSALDEPGPVQSDPTVLDLQLRTLSKRAPGSEAVLVRSIEHADKNPREVQRWIQSVAEVHRSRPPPTVPYARPMPDIERLMQEWPPELEELLKTNALPGADLDMTVDEYARVVCALLDIPVYPSATSAAGSLVQSLHVLFTLYGEFKANAHFAALAGSGGAAAGTQAGAAGGAAGTV